MLRLSEAIRLGAMMLPEVHGPMFGKRDDQICGACAIGTALYAVGTMADRMRWVINSSLSEFSRHWPWTKEYRIHPIDGIKLSACHIIVTLFEMHHWTREQIADWVETIEPREVEEAKPIETTVPVTCRTVA